jgi:hypothetical protein
MIICNEKNGMSITCVDQKDTNNKFLLNWLSVGYNEFIILNGPKRTDVLLNTNNPNLDDLILQLQNIKSNLRTACEIVLNTSHLYVYVLTFSELIKYGGLEIQGRPGVYAVYGFCREPNGKWNIYTNSRENNLFYMTVEITIKDSIVPAEKRGLFSKYIKNEYHKIEINKGYPEVDADLIYYTIESYDFHYPIPEEILQRGGQFFIKSHENEIIRFKSNDASIIIRQ